MSGSLELAILIGRLKSSGLIPIEHASLVDPAGALTYRHYKGPTRVH